MVEVVLLVVRASSIAAYLKGSKRFSMPPAQALVAIHSLATKFQ